MRDRFARGSKGKKGMAYPKAQEKAARIWNAKHPKNPVGRYND